MKKPTDLSTLSRCGWPCLPAALCKLGQALVASDIKNKHGAQHFHRRTASETSSEGVRGISRVRVWVGFHKSKCSKQLQVQASLRREITLVPLKRNFTVEDRSNKESLQKNPFLPSLFASDHFNLVGVTVPAGEPEKNCNEKTVWWLRRSDVSAPLQTEVKPPRLTGYGQLNAVA